MVTPYRSFLAEVSEEDGDNNIPKLSAGRAVIPSPFEKTWDISVAFKSKSIQGRS
jgi:hypothetical protein